MQQEDAEIDADLQEFSSPLLRILREYGRPRWKILILGLAGGMVAFLVSLAPATLLGAAIDTVFSTPPRSLTLPLVPAGMVPANQTGQFVLVVALIVASYLTEGVMNYVRGYGLNRFAQELQHEVRVDTYDAMQRLEMSFFEKNSSGELMSVMNNDVNNLEEFLSGGLSTLARIVFTVLGISAVLFWINWQMALVSLSVVPVIAAFTHLFVRKVQPFYASVRTAVGSLNSLLENNLGGIRVIKASVMEDFETEEVRKLSRNYFDANWRAIRTRIVFFPGMRILAGTSFVLTFTVGGYWVIAQEAPLFLTGTLTVGEFVTFMLLSQQFIWPMANFGEFVNMYQEAYASAERINGLMNEPSRSEDGNERQLEIDEGTVRYEDVSFGYDEEKVVQHLDFEIGDGEMLALAGPTGAGKSTVVKLLLRFYDVDEGRILIDGQDISEVSENSLRKQIGYVSQENILFPESIADNIGYGADGAERERIVEVAKAARAHGFITDLPEGYDTQVGEDGIKLSGGQRQRIGIARALLQDPEILILDEATSDVDTETELKIQRGIEELIEDRTVLAIAHRLSTIKDADEILVLRDGKITEKGTHSQLLQQDGLYAKLWKVQAGEIEDVSEHFLEE